MKILPVATLSLITLASYTAMTFAASTSYNLNTCESNFQRIKVDDMKLSNGQVSHPAYIYTVDKPYEPKYPGNMPFLDQRVDLDDDGVKELILKGDAQGDRGGDDEYFYYTFYQLRKENIYRSIGSVMAEHVQAIPHATHGYMDIKVTRSCYDKNKKVAEDRKDDVDAYLVSETYTLQFSMSKKVYMPTKDAAFLDDNPCGRFH